MTSAEAISWNSYQEKKEADSQVSRLTIAKR
jgi:hypothetical protein